MQILALWNSIPEGLRKFVAMLAIGLFIAGSILVFRMVSCVGHKATEGGTSEKINRSNVPDDSVFDSIIDSLPIHR